VAVESMWSTSAGSAAHTDTLTCCKGASPPTPSSPPSSPPSASVSATLPPSPSPLPPFSRCSRRARTSCANSVSKSTRPTNLRSAEAEAEAAAAPLPPTTLLLRLPSSPTASVSLSSAGAGGGGVLTRARAILPNTNESMCNCFMNKLVSVL
jgi:hypothetical protein